MPNLPIQQAKPLRPDPARPGPKEARRQAALLAPPTPHGQRFPGDGGKSLPSGGGPALRSSHRIADPVWRREDQ
ncbi:MAG TPA: hypothetical protein VIL69_14465 [Roseomonas sp.]|jgi:hypothetical protein